MEHVDRELQFKGILLLKGVASQSFGGWLGAAVLSDICRNTLILNVASSFGNCLEEPQF